MQIKRIPETLSGVTRTKKGLIMVGERKAVYIAIMNNKIVESNTRLGEKLRAALSESIFNRSCELFHY